MRKRIGGSAVIESASACRVEARECRKVFGAAPAQNWQPGAEECPETAEKGMKGVSFSVVSVSSVP